MLERIPQPEDLPPDDRLLQIADLERYMSQLDPFLQFHGYKTTEYGDWLKINSREVAVRLAQSRATETYINQGIAAFANASPEEQAQKRESIALPNWAAVFDALARSQGGKARQSVLDNMLVDQEIQLTTKLRDMPSMRLHFWMFDCGLLEETMAVSATRSPR